MCERSTKASIIPRDYGCAGNGEGRLGSNGNGSDNRTGDVVSDPR